MVVEAVANILPQAKWVAGLIILNLVLWKSDADGHKPILMRVSLPRSFESHVESSYDAQRPIRYHVQSLTMRNEHSHTMAP